MVNFENKNVEMITWQHSLLVQTTLYMKTWWIKGEAPIEIFYIQVKQNKVCTRPRRTKRMGASICETR
jgi:hypothetical protein